jgi:hypothetical protein
MEVIKSLKYNEEMECAMVWCIEGNDILVRINYLTITNIRSTCNLVEEQDNRYSSVTILDEKAGWDYFTYRCAQQKISL